MAERPDPVIDEVGFERVEREPASADAEVDAELRESVEAGEQPTDASPDAPSDATPESAVELGHG